MASVASRQLLMLNRTKWLELVRHLQVLLQENDVIGAVGLLTKLVAGEKAALTCEQANQQNSVYLRSLKHVAHLVSSKEVDTEAFLCAIQTYYRFLGLIDKKFADASKNDLFGIVFTFAVCCGKRDDFLQALKLTALALACFSTSEEQRGACWRHWAKLKTHCRRAEIPAELTGLVKKLTIVDCLSQLPLPPVFAQMGYDSMALLNAELTVYTKQKVELLEESYAVVMEMQQLLSDDLANAKSCLHLARILYHAPSLNELSFDAFAEDARNLCLNSASLEHSIEAKLIRCCACLYKSLALLYQLESEHVRHASDSDNSEPELFADSSSENDDDESSSDNAVFTNYLSLTSFAAVNALLDEAVACVRSVERHALTGVDFQSYQEELMQLMNVCLISGKAIEAAEVGLLLASSNAALSELNGFAFSLFCEELVELRQFSLLEDAVAAFRQQILPAMQPLLGDSTTLRANCSFSELQMDLLEASSQLYQQRPQAVHQILSRNAERFAALVCESTSKSHKDFLLTAHLHRLKAACACLPNCPTTKSGFPIFHLYSQCRALEALIKSSGNASPLRTYVNKDRSLNNALNLVQYFRALDVYSAALIQAGMVSEAQGYLADGLRLARKLLAVHWVLRFLNQLLRLEILCDRPEQVLAHFQTLHQICCPSASSSPPTERVKSKVTVTLSSCASESDKENYASLQHEQGSKPVVLLRGEKDAALPEKSRRCVQKPVPVIQHATASAVKSKTCAIDCCDQQNLLRCYLAGHSAASGAVCGFGSNCPVCSNVYVSLQMASVTSSCVVAQSVCDSLGAMLAGDQISKATAQARLILAKAEGIMLERCEQLRLKFLQVFNGRSKKAPSCGGFDLISRRRLDLYLAECQLHVATCDWKKLKTVAAEAEKYSAAMVPLHLQDFQQQDNVWFYALFAKLMLTQPNVRCALSTGESSASEISAVSNELIDSLDNLSISSDSQLSETSSRKGKSRKKHVKAQPSVDFPAPLLQTPSSSRKPAACSASINCNAMQTRDKLAEFLVSIQRRTLCNFRLHRQICELLGVLYSRASAQMAANYFATTVAVAFRNSFLLNCNVREQQTSHASSVDVSALASDVTERLPKDWTIVQLIMTSAAAGSQLILIRHTRNAFPIIIPICSIADAKMRAATETTATIKEKEKFWSARRELDSKLRMALQALESEVFGSLAFLLLGQSANESVSTAIAEALEEDDSELLQLAEKFGITASASVWQLLLESSLTTADEKAVMAFARQLVPCKNEKFFTSLAELLQHFHLSHSFCQPERAPVLLVLDKDLHNIPWECLPILAGHPVCRVPCLQLLPQMLDSWRLKRTVNPQRTFYFLDPKNEFPATQETFVDWFKTVFAGAWSGLIGCVPDLSSEKMVALFRSAFEENDLYVYCGHGSGSTFVAPTKLRKWNIKATSLLMGCGSVRFKSAGPIFEPRSTTLEYYFSAESVCVVGNMWSVTDKDIDRYLKELLITWAGCPSPDQSFGLESSQDAVFLKPKTPVRKPLAGGKPALDVCSQPQKYEDILTATQAARQKCTLKYLVGAAPVVYGLPVKCPRRQAAKQKTTCLKPRIIP